ncbi:hypothetical protein ONZ45_g3382 [Pleurotus djamor]|nr:hypothetical protein ONZ45_g3382 [Pleurotus djamor]
MAAESSKRSNLIDVTYQQLHALLDGRHEGDSPQQIINYIVPRIPRLGTVSEPFGKPSEASRKKVQSGSVELADKVIHRAEDVDKEFILAISSKFQIDEVEAFILFRSYLYNEGLPSSMQGELVVEELVEAITPFYYSERLYILRSLIPLLRANEDPTNSAYEVATEILPKLVPDSTKFVQSLVKEYTRKTKESVPDNVCNNPRTASRWAKQNMKERLVLLEVLFWTMWSYALCSGPIVVEIYEAAYSTGLASVQQNSTLLLDEEGSQLQQDCAALWMLITVEVLELEGLTGPEAIQLEEGSADSLYISHPESLKRIHQLVTSNSHIALEAKELPNGFQAFFQFVDSQLDKPYSKDRETAEKLMIQACLDTNVGLFDLIFSLLTRSPLFVSSIAFKTGSEVTDPNAIGFRSVLKGLIMALTEIVPVELIPDFDGLVGVWIALFGRSETQSIAELCRQFWQSDWPHGIARRAIFDVARTRFPVQVKPLLQLLRAMTGSGFLDTDELSTADHSHEGLGLSEERALCGRHVFYYMDRLPSYSQVIPVSACSGAHAHYERQQERYGPSGSSGPTYMTLHPIRLPGGSILPARTTGRLLSGEGGDSIVVGWQHEHSGWKLIMEILTDYVNRRRKATGFGGGYHDISFGKRGQNQVSTLQLEDIGVELPQEGDDDLVADCFDLIRSLIQDNPMQAEQLVEVMESGEAVVSHTMVESEPPDVVQLTTMILEESLSRSQTPVRGASRPRLITSAMSVLSALLVLPKPSSRVWLYIRSTTALFGSERSHGFASVALAGERVTGHYTMTLALLHLVQQLFHEAATSIGPDNPRLSQVKEEVLLRAVRFVHTEIWVEHLGWKYAQLGDRLEIGRRIGCLYSEILKYAPPVIEKRPFPTLSQAVADVLLFKATTATMNPLILPVATGDHLLSKLYAARRNGEAGRLVRLLETHLVLIRQILVCKQRSMMAGTPSLLEQALCSRVAGMTISTEGGQGALDPIEVLASLVKRRDSLGNIPLEAMRVLHHLCIMLSSYQASSPTIVGHLSNPESTVASLVRIVQHPYDDLTLRNTVWRFISLAVDKEPALAGLFVTGRFLTPSNLKGKQKETESKEPEVPQVLSALDVAKEVLEGWKTMWEFNPQLLASVMNFLHSVWLHGLEHMIVLQGFRSDKKFWEHIVAISVEESLPVPEYQLDSFVFVDGVRHSNLDEAVATHAYRTMVKAYAIRILSLDIDIHFQLLSSPSTDKPTSFTQFEDHLKHEDQMTDLLSEAGANSYDPTLHDDLMELFGTNFPGMSTELLEHLEPVQMCVFGDEFMFSLSVLRSRLEAYTRTSSNDELANSAGLAERQLSSINLNLSLSHSQSFLTEAWQILLRRVSSYLRGHASIRPTMLTMAALVSHNISREQRSGDMMATLHGIRLSLLLSILELGWFSSTDKPAEVKSFIDVVRNVRGIALNEAQSPAKSIIGSVTTPFHQTLLQLVYFCARHSRTLLRRDKSTTAEQRLAISSMVDSTLTFVIDALAIVFESASSRRDADLDRDMELLVSVFEQCTRQDINSSSTLWLARFQERDILQASINLFTKADIVGLSDIPLLLSRKAPLYAPHILTFHMALASLPSAAQRLASAGVLAAYSNNSISAAASSGLIEVTIPELPNERSPAHRTYCSMLAIVSGILTALRHESHYIDNDASGLIQLFDDQISKALSWTIGEPLTLAFLEEMEQVVHLFNTLAANAPAPPNVHPAVQKVLRVYTNRALLLLQQLNYAVTHPNHLASLFEPITSEERSQLEKEAPISDPLKRPMIAQLLHRLFKLSSNILFSLINISRADTVLIKDQEDWPVQEAFLAPHSKIVLGEPASLGTLLELGNTTLDFLRELTGRPAGQSLTLRTSTTSDEAPLDVHKGVATTRGNLEAILLYGITQLAMWLCKPEFDSGAATGESDGDDAMAVAERRPPRPIAMPGHYRGMTGEVAAGLQSLLSKTQPIIAKSDAVLGKGSVDITAILSNFLRYRIMTPGSL